MVLEQCAQKPSIYDPARQQKDEQRPKDQLLHRIPMASIPVQHYMLHDEVGAMSELLQIQYTTAEGGWKLYIDGFH